MLPTPITRIPELPASTAVFRSGAPDGKIPPARHLQRIMRSALLLSLLSVLLAACADAPPLHHDIGAVHRDVTTASPAAQRWFDRGLANCFGFNHAAALECFEQAIAADPDCAMAHWGVAYALGPNYNAAEVEPEACERAYKALVAANKAKGKSRRETALIEAFFARHPDGEASDRAARDAAYAAAMRRLHRKYRDDADIAAFTAEAVMQLNPWKLWSNTGEPAPQIPEIRGILEPALRRAPNHPALCHLYIHAMEAGPLADRATPAAERLENLTPGLGHLVHMPSHIYIWTGRYADSLRVNQRAVAVDDEFFGDDPKVGMYALYRIHNLHFIAYSGMWTGQSEVALAAAKQISSDIPAPMITAMADFVDVFTATPFHVMVRFGMWDEILAEPEPAHPEQFAARAIWRYARGIALAVLGRTDEATAELAEFERAREAMPASRLLFNNAAKDILAVADDVLRGELAYRRGEYDSAFEHLHRAVKLDEQLNYDEPWGWMEPARHALGALLTEQGRFAEAAVVYQENLERYPNNGWALHGLRECLRGMGRDTEARALTSRFEAAWANADVQIPGSCFCRTR